jgi:UDP-sugar transporter A1/2/3
MKRFITEAVFPAGLYGIQNVAYLMAVQTLDPLTFNVLAQTKTVSAALCCYLLLGRKQSRIQMIALLLLLWAALIMEGVISIDSIGYWERDASSNEWNWHHWTHGVLPILLSTFISGLAGALSQGALQHKNSYIFSMELCAAQSLLLATSLFFSSDGNMILEKGFWHQWEWATFLPIVTGAVGGVLVGLVTKHAGAVYKGFALIAGMFLSGVLQSSAVSLHQALGGIVAAISIFLHATNPPRSDIVKESKKRN